MYPLVNRAMNVLEVRTDIFKRITRNKMNEKGGIGVSEFRLDIFRVGRLAVRGLRVGRFFLHEQRASLQL